MMSVLIKGMEMPRDCHLCPLSHWNKLDDFTGCELKKRFFSKEDMETSGRPNFCPLVEVPSAQPEPLTDKEQRIFLAAMGREEKVCEEVDRNYIGEPYEDSLMSVCRAIKRKVKGALWI